jgi:hypothetical protein
MTRLKSLEASRLSPTLSEIFATELIRELEAPFFLFDKLHRHILPPYRHRYYAYRLY